MSNIRLLRSAATGIIWTIDIDHPDRKPGEQTILMDRIARGQLIDLGPADVAEDPDEF